uniref:Uncharacterized protein n=1 Tax=Leersia perrieri TaxID=77586 RepID=A0A0D9VTQ5_9ORYZ
MDVLYGANGFYLHRICSSSASLPPSSSASVLQLPSPRRRLPRRRPAETLARRDPARSDSTTPSSGRAVAWTARPRRSSDPRGAVGPRADPPATRGRGGEACLAQLGIGLARSGGLPRELIASEKSAVVEVAMVRNRARMRWARTVCWNH